MKKFSKQVLRMVVQFVLAPIIWSGEAAGTIRLLWLGGWDRAPERLNRVLDWLEDRGE